ncbi:AraC family transcriptional regulator [Rouxiella silvae]|uniref:AraC family transcriptional regulator n=1 Tax=Rouxiella silvae TaxID=1646373 RepID=A0AA40WXY6_9GAMM|nr:AraC family transcriptional regulator [Rouxiella silvae]KQN47357.1 AraC family transcriptional regulator [Serratia sp. Leaf50]MBF6635148.1 AraC family transcriptional regulator [Rouxiella silvae]ORJ22423.1 AraC family transcriptional regulator [Rouxiella silvae]
MTDIKQLCEAVEQAITQRGNISPCYTEAEGMILLRSQTHRHPMHLIHKPALCIVAQGEKWTRFGDERLCYRAGEAMLVSVEMPGASQVVEASAEAPYLSVVVELDLAIMNDVYQQMASPPKPDSASKNAAQVIQLTPRLNECVLRALQLLNSPQAIPLLYPGLMKELCYWLLTGPHGALLATTVLGRERHHRLIEAVHVLRKNFDKTLRIDTLAGVAGLSPTAFHRHFRAMTSMTPGQFQKKIRLLEARRLLLSGATSAESVAFQVGYASPSQFSREYARLFGAPPRRDIVNLQAQLRESLD